MKKREKGFIATSLLYSFFLVFLALIMVLINSYIANKTIIDRFNEEIEDDLNGKTYNIRLRVKNGTTIGGVTLINKISNGNFQNLTGWTSSNATPSLSANTLGKYGPNNSYFYQTVPDFIIGHKYFLGVTYMQNHDYPLYSYIDGQTMTQGIVTKRTDKYIKAGTIYDRSDINGSKNVYIGYGNNPGADNITNFRNVVLIDLTMAYGSGNEPDVKWLTENIDFFDTPVSFIKKEWHDGDDATEIEMITYSSRSNVSYVQSETICTTDSGQTITPSFEIIKRNDNINNSGTAHAATRGKVSFKNLTSDVSCYFVWEL